MLDPNKEYVFGDQKVTTLDPDKEYDFGDQQVTTLDPNKEYDFGSSQELYREAPPTFAESAMMIGLDVIPAIIGNIAGAAGGPAGMMVGGGAGGLLGNYWSQEYRISRGLQDDIGYGELGASTILSGIPLGTPVKSGIAAKTAIRATQGAGLAGADTLARTTIDEGRLPTEQEVAATLLFGGIFGGGLGAVEAKWFSKTTGVDVNKDMPRDEVIDALQDAVEEAGGPSNFNATQKIGVDELTTTSGLATNNEVLDAMSPRLSLSPLEYRSWRQACSPP